MKEVGYPTIFSASETTLVQFEDVELENRLSALSPRLGKALVDNCDHVARSIFRLTVLFPSVLLRVLVKYLLTS